MSPEQRRRLVIAAAAVALVLALVVGFLVWPTDSREAGSASTASPAEVGAAAADALAAWPAAALAVSYWPSQSAEDETPVTEADLTVTADGKAAGTLREPEVGTAQAAWSSGDLYLNGDAEFWAAQEPQRAHDLSSAGRWVKPEKRSGYYLLDSFGVDAATLTPKALADLVRAITSDPSVEQAEPQPVEGGRTATAYTADDWTVLIEDAAPRTVLGLGGNPHSSESTVHPAAWHPTTPAIARPAVLRPAQDEPDDHYSSPYLSVRPRPADPAKAAEVPSTVAGAASAATPPGPDSGESATKKGPDFQVDEDSPALCDKPTCVHVFQVTNAGSEAADATLYTNDPGSPGQPNPLGTLKPGESRSVTFSHGNLARPGQTVNYTVNVWVYSSALYGPDPEVPTRLRDRGLEPDKQSELSSVDAPLRPAATRLLDAMTRSVPPSDPGAGNINASALKALDNANRLKRLPLLAKVLDSGRLQNPDDLRRLVAENNTIGKYRELEQVAHLLQADPTARVWFNGKYPAPDGEYKADAIYTGTENGKPVRRCVQIKTGLGERSLTRNLRDGAEQLNGQKTDSDELCPPGFERVLQVYLEPTVGVALHDATRDALEAYFKDKRRQQFRQNMCDENGKVRVDRLVVINSVGVHQWTDLRNSLGIPC
ncbi:hypothetical protein M8542_01785 [Amycolatopsis sp. OK19-0408]|uniref:Uncharacterized protein n=1 Tax=Amycolatopsis iheyensis TaxID=2945988 RepID=A0A9X2SH75_9PSEU|nr:hypothetical protein [Amycolatopsis iheyensis]MCR6481538.1 hypothetical protein [Amycolatopsis iheyensis]